MKLALIFVILASLLVAASFAEPECFDSEKPSHHEECKTCQKEKKCRDPAPSRDGRDGINGQNGLDGFNGYDGVDGTNGTNGIDAPNAEAEFAQVYSLREHQPAVGNLIFFERNGLLSPGMSHPAAYTTPGSFVTVARAGTYRVTVKVNPAIPQTGGAIGSCALQINGVPLVDPQYTFTAGATSAGALGANFLSADVYVGAGQTVSIVTLASFYVTATPTTTPNFVMNVISLKLN